MSTRKMIFTGCCLLLCSAWSCQSRDGGVERTRLGRPASPEVIARMDLTIAPDGVGLPVGSGSVEEGRATFAAKCATCHGTAGSGGIAGPLTGGVGSLTSAKPVKTVASYWPYATTIFDYVRRAMPLTQPQSLTNPEVYGLVAYLLSVDGIVPPGTRLDALSVPKLKMPNRDGFVSLEPARFDGNIERIRNTPSSAALEANAGASGDMQ